MLDEQLHRPRASRARGRHQHRLAVLDHGLRVGASVQQDLDEVGTAARKLETSLGDLASPFARALASSSATVEAFVDEVEGRHKLPLR